MELGVNDCSGNNCSLFFGMRSEQYHGEFDPGSELTLVACLSHASRTRKPSSEGEYSGGRVSNAWVTCLRVGNNIPNGVLIPNNVTRRKLSSPKVASACKLPLEDGPASY